MLGFDTPREAKTKFKIRGVRRVFERGRLRGCCGKGPGAQPGGAAPGNFLTEFYAKPIGYQYRRFKAVDNTL